MIVSKVVIMVLILIESCVLKYSYREIHDQKLPKKKR